MEMTFRWYGQDDPVKIEYIRQIPGMKGIVTAIYDIPVGEVWPLERILELTKTTKDGTNFYNLGEAAKEIGAVNTIVNTNGKLKGFNTDFYGFLYSVQSHNVSFEGKLIAREKIRTKKKVIKAIVEKMEQFADDGFDYAEKCFISNSACLEDAAAVAALIEERFPKLKGKVLINSIGTTIGSHTGPGTVALFFWGAERED